MRIREARGGLVGHGAADAVGALLDAIFFGLIHAFFNPPHARGLRQVDVSERARLSLGRRAAVLVALFFLAVHALVVHALLELPGIVLCAPAGLFVGIVAVAGAAGAAVGALG